ncbi:Heterokaryon incompatibility [Penicillium occitanis (nom. inval.)]|nr:Heterokaryon incompatibility [Penicillium occitanis (nom. inval.)]PCG89319.1 hypothetical protein PENOC_107000 [Penicillium occitanis (nom. inval.)]
MPPKLLTSDPFAKSDNSIWSYDEYANVPRTAGAFRVIDVSALLDNDPKIYLYEWTDIRYANPSTSTAAGDHLRRLKRSPEDRYLAVSHVWSRGDEVDEALTNFKGPDLIYIETSGKPEKISWVGLKEIAQAAHELDVTWIWLDFFCIDQVDKDDLEKGLEICIMADIYTWAHCVLVMIGGVAAVQGIKGKTAWMDRAWTLQESIVNKENTYVYMKWPRGLRFLQHPTIPSISWPLRFVGRVPNSKLDYRLVRLEHLLDISDLSSHIPQAKGMVVLDGNQSIANDSPRRALRAALSSNNMIKYAGVWRSMFMRTSSKPVDVVYSIMGIFGLQIDPFRKNRSSTFLFEDLARKTAAISNIGPAWLTIGGIMGSDIPYNKASGIIPMFPHTEPANKPSKNKPPTMIFHKKFGPDWVGYHVDDSPFYVDKYDIRFLTHSHPHIINCTMLKTYNPSPKPSVSIRPTNPTRTTRKVAGIRLGTMTGRLRFWGNLDNAHYREIQAVYVGRIANMNNADVNLGVEPHVDFDGDHYFLFLQFNSSGWRVVANGVFHTRHWRVSPKCRYIFTMGKGAQTKEWRWPTKDAEWLDWRDSPFGHSYGIEPLQVPPRDTDRIGWFGYKQHYPSTKPKWKERRIPVDMSEYLRKNKDADKPENTKVLLTKRLALLSARAYDNEVPTTARSYTPHTLFQVGQMPVAFSYNGWPKALCTDLSKGGLDGILIHKTKTGKSRIKYHIRLYFGERVMYIQMKPQWDVRRAFWQMCAVPYPPNLDSQPIRNRRYIVRQTVPAPIFTALDRLRMRRIQQGLSPDIHVPHSVLLGLARTQGQNIGINVSPAAFGALEETQRQQLMRGQGPDLFMPDYAFGALLQL